MFGFHIVPNLARCTSRLSVVRRYQVKVLLKMGGGSHDRELAPYPFDDDGDDWDLADVLVDSLVDLSAIIHLELNLISKLCGSANVIVRGDDIGVFSLALQNLNACSEPKSVEAMRAFSLERVRIDEETAAASLAAEFLSWLTGLVNATSRPVRWNVSGSLGVCSGLRPSFWSGSAIWASWRLKRIFSFRDSVNVSSWERKSYCTSSCRSCYTTSPRLKKAFRTINLVQGCLSLHCWSVRTWLQIKAHWPHISVVSLVLCYISVSRIYLWPLFMTFVFKVSFTCKYVWEFVVEAIACQRHENISQDISRGLDTAYSLSELVQMNALLLVARWVALWCLFLSGTQVVLPVSVTLLVDWKIPWIYFMDPLFCTIRPLSLF